MRACQANDSRAEAGGDESAASLDLLLSSRARSLARELLRAADERNMRVATAESCTGGLLSTILTGLPGLSHSFECGFVVYSDEAKTRLLGVPGGLVSRFGAVSKEVAVSMAEHALDRGGADVALAITGFAGPGEDEADEEGLVHLAVALRSASVAHVEEHFGRLGRDGVRQLALEVGLELLNRAICSVETGSGTLSAGRDFS